MTALFPGSGRPLAAVLVPLPPLPRFSVSIENRSLTPSVCCTDRPPATPRGWSKAAWSSGCNPVSPPPPVCFPPFLAGRGITGSRGFLTGTYGFYPLYEQGAYTPSAVTEDLGAHYSILDLSIKPYPSCRMTHSSIGAALALKDRVGPIDAIRQIDVSVSAMVAEMVGKPFEIGANPQVDAQFSIPYTTACALVRGDVFLQDFEPRAIDDSTVKRLADRVRIAADPALPQKDILQARMEITLSDGTTVGELVPMAPGQSPQPHER